MQPDQIDTSNLTYEEELCRKLEEEARLSAEARSCTGVLGIHPMARDIKIDNFSVTFYGSELLQDTKLELSVGNRYGLIGANGCGKSALLAVLGNREVPIQEHVDIYYLDREVPASEKTAIQAVMEADEERIKLEKLAEELATIEDNEAQEYLMQVYERLDDLGADSAEARASHLLSGLQFTAAMQNKKCKDFSGGWRMRVSLARALFIRPHLLLLDEPTNNPGVDLSLAGFPQWCLQQHHALRSKEVEDVRRQLRHLHEDPDGAGREPDEAVSVGTGPDRSHEELYRTVWPRQRQVSKASSVEGEDFGKDGGRRADRESEPGEFHLLLFLLLRHDTPARCNGPERQLPIRRNDAVHLQEP